MDAKTDQIRTLNDQLRQNLIHFGQEKGSELIIHDDVKERLIEDAAKQISPPGERPQSPLDHPRWRPRFRHGMRCKPV